jgi:hypothetical protein
MTFRRENQENSLSGKSRNTVWLYRLSNQKILPA